MGEGWEGTDNDNNDDDNDDKNDGGEVDGCGNRNKHWFSRWRDRSPLLLGYFHILAVLFNPVFDFLKRVSPSSPFLSWKAAL